MNIEIVFALFSLVISVISLVISIIFSEDTPNTIKNWYVNKMRLAIFRKELETYYTEDDNFENTNITKKSFFNIDKLDSEIFFFCTFYLLNEQSLSMSSCLNNERTNQTIKEALNDYLAKDKKLIYFIGFLNDSYFKECINKDYKFKTKLRVPYKKLSGKNGYFKFNNTSSKGKESFNILAELYFYKSDQLGNKYSNLALEYVIMVNSFKGKKLNKMLFLLFEKYKNNKKNEKEFRNDIENLIKNEKKDENLIFKFFYYNEFLNDVDTNSVFDVLNKSAIENHTSPIENDYTEISRLISLSMLIYQENYMEISDENIKKLISYRFLRRNGVPTTELETNIRNIYCLYFNDYLKNKNTQYFFELTNEGVENLVSSKK